MRIVCFSSIVCGRFRSHVAASIVCFPCVAVVALALLQRRGRRASRRDNTDDADDADAADPRRRRAAGKAGWQSRLLRRAPFARAERDVVQADACGWLDALAQLPDDCAVLTSPPDFAEGRDAMWGGGGLAAWEAWFADACRRVVAKAPRGALVAFYVTDTCVRGAHVDKVRRDSSGGIARRRSHQGPIVARAHSPRSMRARVPVVSIRVGGPRNRRT
jgi:hypothetical protein